MKAFYVFIAIAVIVASVAAMEEEEEELFQMLEKRSLDTDEVEEMLYGSEPMVKRGRFKCKSYHCNLKGSFYSVKSELHGPTCY